MEHYGDIVADKGFMIHKDCCGARFITLQIPSGKRGTAQMSMNDLNQTKQVATIRILVEQIIRHVKTFRILKYAMSIYLIGLSDNR